MQNAKHQKIFFCFLCVLSWPILLTAPATARPLQGFHEGPYLQFVSGARNADFDTNIVDAKKISREVEPLFGCNFGWNIRDDVAVELAAQYTSTGTHDTQQHLMNLLLGAKYFLLTDALTHFSSLRILPFVSGGALVQLNVQPGATGASEPRVLQWGSGLHAGAGASFLFYHDTMYLTAQYTTAAMHRFDASQIIGGASQLVYAGGWARDWSATLGTGVHF